ncbi:Hypothetical predicted protein [Mytilus galloprovincialis]|uniref:Uncharacterized protein n=1 Tax=Mytilus galloprovincialis TaxID=29158 RepID=A0A8B6EQB3_MYTGA|nr:Hypothetical predicted protein [Mytilus galloprovincialis]
MPNVIDQIIKSNEYKENVKFEEKESISFEIMFETPKKQRFKPKLFSEKRNTFNLIHSVTEQKIKSHESIEDVKHEKKESISFDIMFETPKKQRSNMSKARLTSCKTKTQFQSKPSIDGKKDKIMDKNTKRRNQQLLTVYKIADEYLDGAHKEEQVQTEKKHEKSHIVPSKTPEVNLSNGGKLGGKFTKGKLGGKFANDVKRKDDNEIRFRFSFLHGTTTYPSGISVMSFSKREDQAKNSEANQNPVSPIPVTISKEQTCSGLASEFLQLPPITTKKAMANMIHSLSTSGLTRLTQKKEEIHP